MNEIDRLLNSFRVQSNHKLKSMSNKHVRSNWFIEVQFLDLNLTHPYHYQQFPPESMGHSMQ